MRFRLVSLLALVALPVAAQVDSTRGVQTSSVTQYRLQPGDVLRIRVWGQDDFSGEFQVDERGIIDYPVLGEISIADATIYELRDRIREGLTELFRSPFVSITPLFRMAVLGHVQAPGLYVVDPTLTVLDVVAMAGGPDAEGSLGKIRLLRDGASIPFDLGGAGAFGRTLSEIGVRSGDEIMVGRRFLTRQDLLTIVAVLQLGLSIIILTRQ